MRRRTKPVTERVTYGLHKQPNAKITKYGENKEYHATKGWRVGKRYGKDN